MTFDATVVGGLSGLSYDPGSRLYYIISDDRSAKNPARFYTARITCPTTASTGSSSCRRIPGWMWTVDRSGRSTSDVRPPVVPPDPEGIAFDGRRQRLYWSSEGERVTDDPDAPVLLDPSVRIATLDGGFVGEFTVPPMLHMSTGQTGPRQNRGAGGARPDAERAVPVGGDGRPGLQRRRTCPPETPAR